MKKLSETCAGVLLLSGLVLLNGATASVSSAADLRETRPWTLEECISYAVEHNITVKQQEIAVLQSDVRLNTSLNSRLPGVSAGASENFSFGRGLTADNTYSNTNTTNTSLNIGVEVPVFRGFQIKHDIAAKKLDLEAATADLDRIKDDIRTNVAQAYFQILYNREILAVAVNQVEIDSMQTLRLEEMLLNGKASKAEVMQQKSSLAQSRLSRTEAENELNMSVLAMSQLLELPSPDGLNVAGPDVENFEPGLLDNPEDIYSAAVSGKPKVKAESIRLQADSVNIRLAKSSLMPTLSLSGGVGTNYYTTSKYSSTSFTEQMKNNFSQFIGLSLNIPIFSRFQNRNTIRSAELAYRHRQLEVENIKKSIYKEVQQAYYNAIAASAKYTGSVEAEASAKESFELVKAKYETGKANITEFNESRNGYLKSASDLAQAKYRYLYQAMLLDFYKHPVSSLMLNSQPQ